MLSCKPSLLQGLNIGRLKNTGDTEGATATSINIEVPHHVRVCVCMSLAGNLRSQRDWKVEVYASELETIPLPAGRRCIATELLLEASEIGILCLETAHQFRTQVHQRQYKI